MTVDHLPSRTSEPVTANRDTGYYEFQGKRRAHWDEVALRGGGRRGFGGAYHDRLAEVFRLAIPSGLRVLELGCGRGELLAALGEGVSDGE